MFISAIRTSHATIVIKTCLLRLLTFITLHGKVIPATLEQALNVLETSMKAARVRSLLSSSKALIYDILRHITSSAACRKTAAFPKLNHISSSLDIFLCHHRIHHPKSVRRSRSHHRLGSLRSEETPNNIMQSINKHSKYIIAETRRMKCEKEEEEKDE